MKLIFIVLSFGFGALANYSLPWYIKKCSFSDPNLNQCIVTNGNLAIPEIVKGDCFFNNPKSVPLFIPEINLPGDDFTVTLRSAYLRGLETFKLIQVGFNISTIDQFVILEGPFLEISADYLIYDTTKLVRSIHGGGKLEAALNRNTATYRVAMKLQQENGILWMEVDNHRLSLQTRKIYYDYSDTYSHNYDDLNGFLTRHKQIINARIRPAIESVLLGYVSNLVTNLVNKLTIYQFFTS